MRQEQPHGRGWGQDILKKACNDAKDFEDTLEEVSDDAADISEKVIDEGKDKLFQGQNKIKIK